MKRFITLIAVLISLGPVCIGAGWDIPVREHILDNGMKVLTVCQPDAPVVSFALFYRVGSIDEQPGKTGIAHYCEHMMFKTTKNLPGESFARLLGAVGGGHSNANTSFDRTCYHETVPPDRLELVIRLEAERMANLQPSREEAAKELDVVLEELRLHYLDDPSGRLRFELYQHAFDVHPYKTITIGKKSDVESITYEDLMRFQKKYYIPNNAVAVIVGKFDPQELMNLMNRFFGSIPAGPEVLRNYPQEPIQTSERRFEINMPIAQPLYIAGYKMPAASDPDNLALQVLAKIISHGGSSPFGMLSQGENPVAMYAYAWCRAPLDPGLFIVGGVPLPGKSCAELEQRIDEIVQNIIQNGVDAEQLDIARTQILAQQVYRMQSSMAVAMILGEAEMVTSWKDALDVAGRLQALTPEKIQEVAAHYLIPEHRTTGICRPAPEPGQPISETRSGG